MKKTILSFACCFAAGTTLAAETSVLIFGASHHGSCDAARWNCELSSSNPGLGLELAEPGPDYTLFIRGGGYRDSLRETAYFVAGGGRKQWEISDEVVAGAGVMVGYLNGSGVHGLAGLPFVTVGGKLLQLEIGYAPKLQWKDRMMPATTTFSLRWQLQ
ncbi:MAG: hypothetical protein ACK4FZ_12265 [Vogesella sp.]|uniref:hypothetical protein n=1 Tax=Vogesella sp. TaxID=1904252 RepID=UPI003918AD64